MRYMDTVDFSLFVCVCFVCVCIFVMCLVFVLCVWGWLGVRLYGLFKKWYEFSLPQ